MIRLIAAVFALLLSLWCIGQEKPKQLITLNDGSRLSGIIVSDSLDILEVKILDNQILSIKKGDVLAIKAFENNDQTLSKNKGYFIHFTTSVLVGKNDLGNAYNMSFHLSNGYQLSNGLSLGIGSGIEHLDVHVIPLYAEINYHPINSRISPYTYLKTGYGFALLEDETQNNYYYEPITDSKGGFLFNAGVGIAMYTWQKAAVTIGIGYRYQKVTTFRRNDWWGGSTTTEFETTFQRIELQLGFIFR
ncbi:MAG: hypothetical protein PHS05_02455 [Bacteroidales bacterium]|nr:hypothetical protein [Bacteroidales bacterium]